MDNKARLRIENLLDDHSFVEFGAAITARSTDFNTAEPKEASDGVITGHGLINDRLVFVYSQDVSVLNGTIGEMHAKKITNLYDMALKMGAPIVGFIDCGGVRLYESMDAIEAIGSIIMKASQASGTIPQITAVAGNCGGGLSTLVGISDYALMLDGASLYVNSPDTIEGNYRDNVDSSSASFQFDNGNVDAVCNEDDMSVLIRNYIDMVPDNNMDYELDEASEDDLNRGTPALLDELSDMSAFISDIADDNIFVELKAGVKNVVTGFIRLAGQTVGVCGNEELEDGSRLTTAGAEKLTDFVNYCDAFSIPVLTITNIDGFECDFATDKLGMNVLSKLALAFASADVPKINLIAKNAMGSSYIFMNSKAIGADMVFAYDSSNMALMDEKNAAKILSANGGDANELASTYADTHTGINNAARRGIVDRIINPVDTRKYLIDGFEMLYSKNDYVDIKKHNAK